MIPVPPAPLLSLCAWTLILLASWHLIAFVGSVARQARTLHRIPCSHCRFFTGSPYLKCSVQPAIACSEDAIHCGDYCPPPESLL
ncbi:MAG: hypothetical protein ACO4AI_01600 [Prochlorothrix sp.]|nr:hypothetical protein [Prochlorothrix sp.]